MKAGDPDPTTPKLYWLAGRNPVFSVEARVVPLSNIETGERVSKLQVSAAAVERPQRLGRVR